MTSANEEIESSMALIPKAANSGPSSTPEQELAMLRQQVVELRQQQAATVNVLRLIASGRAHGLETVLDQISETARHLFDASDVRIRRLDGNILRLAGKAGGEDLSIRSEIMLGDTSISGRLALGRQSIHIPDLSAVVDEYPEAASILELSDIRSIVGAPLQTDEAVIGIIMIRRSGVRPFSEAQVALVQTFADQAVIAIENARLFEKLVESNKDLTESLEQQTATSEVLRVIASTPTNLRSVLEAVADNAMRLCDAEDAIILRRDGDQLRTVAHVGSIQLGFTVRPLSRERTYGQAILERRTIQVEDLQAAPLVRNPDTGDVRGREAGIRTVLATPLLHQEVAIGVIFIRRTEVLPFTQKQIALLETFADQAVIAIENARLFQDLDERNRELTDSLARETEALKQQTAMSEVLRVIARSPTNLQAVLDTLAESATTLCDGVDTVIRRIEGDQLPMVAHYGPIPGATDLGLTRGTIVGRACIEGRTIQVADMRAISDEDYFDTLHPQEWRAIAATPLMSQGEAIGVLALRRYDPGELTPRQISLLETFADQAVIAIENARLFQELDDRNRQLTQALARETEALKQQTATSDVLRVIASSPTDLRGVLQTLVENAASLCGTEDASVRRLDGNVLKLMAVVGTQEGVRSEDVPISSDWIAGRAVLERRTIHVPDLLGDSGADFPGAQARLVPTGLRAMVSTPLLREGVPIGVFIVRRYRDEPFTPSQISLLETFADQAVIAIENARLFGELEERNRDLVEALEQQTATGDVLRAISSSPSDMSPVFETILENAGRLCEADLDLLYLFDQEQTTWDLVAQHGVPSEWLETHRRLVRPAPTTGLGRMLLGRETIHIPDLTDDPAYKSGDPLRVDTVKVLGARTWLGVPLLKGAEILGAIVIYRRETRPFAERQIQLVETFADQAVIAIENTRLFGELQERTRELAQSVEELQALGAVSQAVSSTLDLQKVLTTVLEHALDLSGMDGGAVFEFDELTGEFHDRATIGLGEGVVRGPLREAPLHIGEGMLGRAVQERRPLQVPDIQEEGAYFGRMHETLIQAGYRAMLAVPLLREDEVIGGLVVRRGTPGEVPQRTIELLQTFATQSALAIQNARLFNELAEKSQQLEVASQHKSQFLANMSHELRTPLNAILGYTELILDEIYGDVPPKIAETLDRVQQSGRHLLGLINDVLDLSKMEAGQLVLAPQEYTLTEVIQTVCTAVESLASEKDIGLRTEIEPDLPMGYGDDRRLVQVILNLVGNAIKFTDRGEVVISATTDDGRQTTDDSTDVAERFVIAVRDTGPGISPEQQERIFEEFQQADASSTREKGGTGLGLSIAKRIVELHGGRIWVESEEGQGSTFAFEIPVRIDGARGV
jgi:GAF domain-containing protein